MTFPDTEDILKNDETILQMISPALHIALTTHNNPEVLPFLGGQHSQHSFGEQAVRALRDAIHFHFQVQGSLRLLGTQGPNMMSDKKN